MTHTIVIRAFTLCLGGIVKGSESSSGAPAALGAAQSPAQLSLSPSGLTSTLVGTKGCSTVGAQNSQKTTIHSAPPGVLVASYTHFCSSDLCNSASSSSVLLNSLPPQGMGSRVVEK